MKKILNLLAIIGTVFLVNCNQTEPEQEDGKIYRVEAYVSPYDLLGLDEKHNVIKNQGDTIITFSQGIYQYHTSTKIIGGADVIALLMDGRERHLPFDIGIDNLTFTKQTIENVSDVDVFKIVAKVAGN